MTTTFKEWSPEEIKTLMSFMNSGEGNQTQRAKKASVALGRTPAACAAKFYTEKAALKRKLSESTKSELTVTKQGGTMSITRSTAYRVAKKLFGKLTDDEKVDLIDESFFSETE